MNRFIKYFAVATATALLLCSCGNDVQDSTSGYIENPFTTTPTETTLSSTSEPTEEELIEKTREDALALTQKVITHTTSIEGSIDNTFDYNGGNIEIDFDPVFYNAASTKPEYMSLGVMVTLNGIPQNISINGSEKTQFYIQEYYLNEAKTGYNQTEMDISFEPVIAKEDKDENAIILSITLTINPHFRASKLHPGVHTIHSRITLCNYLCNVKTPITSYSDTKIGTGFEEELITDKVLLKYKACYDVSNVPANLPVDDGLSNMVYLTEDGKPEIGAIFVPHKSGKYRLYFLVNGENAKLTDGTDCIEVDTKVGYLYYLAPVEIAGAEVYDSISVFPVKCTSERTGFTMASIDFPWVIRPAEDEGKTPF